MQVLQCASTPRFCCTRLHSSAKVTRRRLNGVVVAGTKTEEKDLPNTEASPTNEVASEAPVLSSSPVKTVRKESTIRETLRLAYRRILLELSSLPRSMIVMGCIAALASLGTVVEQGKSLDFYIENYPDGNEKMLGFLTYRILLFLQLDHIYTAPYFYGLLFLLVAQLMACTSTRQWPIAKAAQRWRFKETPAAIRKLQNAEILPDANIKDLGFILSKKGYEIFLRDGKLYGFKNLVGRLAPIGVHAAMLLTMAGISWGVLGGQKGLSMIPEDQEITIKQALVPNSPLAIYPNVANKTLHVDNFNIDYRSDGSISQFYSDVTITDPSTQSSYSKKISVNNPLRYQGITLYQTDWGMAALNVTLESEAFEETKTSVRLPMASLPNRKDSEGRVFATFIPSPNRDPSQTTPQGVSVLARDFQTVVLYDSKGEFVGVRRPGSGTSIDVDGMKVTIESITGSTGLEFKSDPGVPVVYAGFAGMMITTLLSYLSHGQIWALQHGRDLHVGGKSNRTKYLFDQELSEILDAVPDSGPLS